MAFIDGVGKGKQVPVDLVDGTRGVRGVRGSGRTVVVMVH